MTRKVLVVGGGPAGSISATLLARAGLSVTLLERERFPRYHIGESIAPSCRAIIDYAGVGEKIEARGYQVKRGILLRWGTEKEWAVDWREMFGEDIRSWQVDRADFDAVLLDHAASQGVEVIQQATVKEIHFADGRAVAADWEHEGRTRRTDFDYVVDASGRAGILSARQLKNRRRHDEFRNVAISAYYRGGTLLPRTPAGGINCISSPQGWYWVIPLKDDEYSVGFVTHQTQFQQRRPKFASLEEMFHGVVGESETVRDLVAGGTFRGPVRVEQDFSYVADEFCGPGYFMAGDAACFLDPLLSTGVHLAMYSGLLAAASINAIEHGDVTEPEAQGFYEALYRNAYQRAFSLVSGMYGKYQGRKHYFWLAQTLLREGSRTEEPDSAFGAIIAGLSDLQDATSGRGVAPALGLGEAAEIARRRAVDQQQPSGMTTAPMKIDPDDLYDAVSGLSLVTEDRLGIRRRV
ncbi:NAD(P)/FAD-dependent oxidoreductase [Streptomyces sp. NPDC051320]|uniref:NAD(P)/FAD-dependent oxidoreductase n=1 Tax=Streptomyces sp. NPDC051320 TaxID=3154644 RepID=UPI00343AAF49